MSIPRPTDIPDNRRRLRMVALPGMAAALAFALGACGGSSTSTLRPAAQNSSSQSPRSNRNPQQPPAVFGTAAAISGSTVQVQSPSSGQVAVTVTPSTRITQTLTASSSDVTVGACVVALGTPPPAGSTSTTQPTSFTARSVVITPATSSGTCAGPGGGGLGGRAFFGGPRTGSPGSSRSSGTTPSSRPRSRAPGQRPVNAFGKVTSVSGSTFVVSTTNGPRTVTTGSSTTFTKTVSATQSAITVGECVTAVGPADTTGAVTATSMSLRQPGPNGCTAGIGRGRFGGGGFGGGGGGGGGGGAGATGQNASYVGGSSTGA